MKVDHFSLLPAPPRLHSKADWPTWDAYFREAASTHPGLWTYVDAAPDSDFRPAQEPLPADFQAGALSPHQLSVDALELYKLQYRRYERRHKADVQRQEVLAQLRLRMVLSLDGEILQFTHRFGSCHQLYGYLKWRFAPSLTEIMDEYISLAESPRGEHLSLEQWVDCWLIIDTRLKNAKAMVDSDVKTRFVNAIARTDPSWALHLNELVSDRTDFVELAQKTVEYYQRKDQLTRKFQPKQRQAPPLPLLEAPQIRQEQTGQLRIQGSQKKAREEEARLEKLQKANKEEEELHQRLQHLRKEQEQNEQADVINCAKQEQQRKKAEEQQKRINQAKERRERELKAQKEEEKELQQKQENSLKEQERNEQVKSAQPEAPNEDRELLRQPATLPPHNEQAAQATQVERFERVEQVEQDDQIGKATKTKEQAQKELSDEAGKVHKETERTGPIEQTEVAEYEGAEKDEKAAAKNPIPGPISQIEKPLTTSSASTLRSTPSSAASQKSATSSISPPSASTPSVATNWGPDRCLCHADHSYRECRYLVPSLAPKWWKGSDQTREDISIKLRNSEKLRMSVRRAVEEGTKLVEDREKEIEQNRQAEREREQQRQEQQQQQQQQQRKSKSKGPATPKQQARPTKPFVTGSKQSYQAAILELMERGSRLGFEKSFVFSPIPHVHICNDKSRFLIWEHVEDNLVDGNPRTEIHAKGTAYFKMLTPRGRIIQQKIHNTQYVPAFPMNVISESRLRRRGQFVDEKSLQLVDADGECVAHLEREHGMILGEHHRAEDESSDHDGVTVSPTLAASAAVGAQGGQYSSMLVPPLELDSPVPETHLKEREQLACPLVARPALESPPLPQPAPPSTFTVPEFQPSEQDNENESMPDLLDMSEPEWPSTQPADVNGPLECKVEESALDAPVPEAPPEEVSKAPLVSVVPRLTPTAPVFSPTAPEFKPSSKPVSSVSPSTKLAPTAPEFQPRKDSDTNPMTFIGSSLSYQWQNQIPPSRPMTDDYAAPHTLSPSPSPSSEHSAGDQSLPELVAPMDCDMIPAFTTEEKSGAESAATLFEQKLGGAIHGSWADEVEEDLPLDNGGSSPFLPTGSVRSGTATPFGGSSKRKLKA